MMRRMLPALTITIAAHHTLSAAAAGIASLVGNCPPDVALSEAVLRFRAVSIDDLTYEDFLVSPIQSVRGTVLFHSAFRATRRSPSCREPH